MIVSVGQGGLGLPDRDYYTKEDAKSKEIRARYLLHVQKMFELLGDSPATAKKGADTVMRIETSLAAPPPDWKRHAAGRGVPFPVGAVALRRMDPGRR
jgi:predicted metalloendopeptidase